MLRTNFPGLRAAAGAVALGSLLALAGPPAARCDTPDPGADAPPRVLFYGGTLRTWDGASTDLAALPKWITVRLGAPLGTLSLDGGRLLMVLGKAAEGSEKSRRRQEGAALLLGWPGGSPADLGFKSQFVVPFQGIPLLGAGNGRHAWVYASEGAPTAPGQMGRAWVHDIDFLEGRLADSTFLPGTVRGLAVEPEGSRIYAGVDDRILSLTTHPLVTSWHYRSPGPNGPLAIAPDGRILAALRGTALALFDAREIAARSETARRGRADDATHVVLLDRPPHGLAFSDDGRLVAVFGSDRVIYVDAASGVRLGEERVDGLGESDELRPLRFSRGGGDLVVAALPSGAVAALPSPEPSVAGVGSAIAPVDEASAAEPKSIPAGLQAGSSAEVSPPGGPQAASPESASHHGTEPATPPAAAPSSRPEAADPDPAGAPQAKPVDTTAPETAAPETTAPETTTPASPAPTSPVPAPPEGPPTLSGRIGGETGLVKGVVIYGPGSIIREYWRTRVEGDGRWSMPLPPPGVYRVVPIGDGSTPIPVRPGFLSITVEAGRSIAAIDFTAGAVN